MSEQQNGPVFDAEQLTEDALKSFNRLVRLLRSLRVDRETPEMVLRRVIQERTAAETIEGGEVYANGCCYCHNGPAERETPDSLAGLESMPGSRYLCRCRDREACLDRMEALE